jgi:hypothetical protein
VTSGAQSAEGSEQANGEEQMPTLILGLGGTGTKVVRILQDHWARFGETPRDVALGIIDARSTSPEGGPIQQTLFTPNPGIRFSASFDEFREELRSWWPEQITPDDAIDFSDGCGAIRANGRFFCFRFASAITDTLRKARETLLTKTLKGSGKLDTRFHVYLVGSLGNGTGGGIFMDVAAIAKHELAVCSTNVRVVGVFLPGSVTRWGNDGSLGARVAASGYAALLEAQQQFDRRVPSSPLRPDEDYVFRAWDGNDVIPFQPGYGLAEASSVPPIDMIFLLDRMDRQGLESTYPTLINVAAEGIAMLIEGADADARVLDAVVKTEQGRAFASFGCARLSVPAVQLLEYTVCRHAQATIALASSEDVTPWRSLFRFQSLDGQKVFAIPDDGAWLAEATDFFLDAVLGVKESKGGEGALANQLLDRFAASDTQLRKSFDNLLSDVETLPAASDIVQKASEISIFVQRNTQDLQRIRLAALTGPDSLWTMRPAPAQAPKEAGVKWIIDNQVSRFVRAGAFGALLSWLRELARQIRVHKTSLAHYERSKYLAETKHAELDVEQRAEELKREADTIFAFFKKARLREDVSDVGRGARKKFDFLLWRANIEACEGFYEVMLDHLDLLSRSVEKVLDRFSDKRLTAPIEHDLMRLQAELDINLKQEVTQQGLKVELFVGGDEAMREQLLQSVMSHSSTSPEAVLPALEAKHEAMFFDALGKDAERFGLELKPRSTTGELSERYRLRLLSVTKEKLETAIAQHCAIDRLLVAKAQAKLERYYELVILGSTAVDQRPAQHLLQELTEDTAPQVVDGLRQLDWRNQKARAMQTAVLQFIAGSVAKAVSFATPQWSLVRRERDLAALLRFTFLNYNAMETIPEAIETMTKLGLCPHVKGQLDPSLDPRRIDILSIEVGGHLSLLEQSTELQAYQRTLSEARAFTPHTTRQAHEMGLAFLRSQGKSPSNGSLWVALAEIYGLLDSDAQGHFRLAVDISGRSESGRVLFNSKNVGTRVGPRGLEALAGYLEGSETDAVMYVRTFKTLLWESMQREVHGEQGVSKAVGWGGVATKLRAGAARIRERAALQGGSLATTLVRQADELERFAAELEPLPPRATPHLFS